jgi:hypothetical protein
VTRRRGRRRKKLLDDLKYRRGYSQLKEESLDRIMWRNRFGGGFGPVVRQITEWMRPGFRTWVTIRLCWLRFLVHHIRTTCTTAMQPSDRPSSPASRSLHTRDWWLTFRGKFEATLMLLSYMHVRKVPALHLGCVTDYPDRIFVSPSIGILRE